MRANPGMIDLGTIELGVAGPEDAPAEPDAASGRRRWWPLAILSAALVASTGSAAAPMPRLALAFAVPAAQVTQVALADGSLYVATGTPASITVPDPEWRVSAYRLPDGEPLWTVTHDEAARSSDITVEVVDGVPLVTGWRLHYAPGRPPVEYEGRTTAYDPATGDVRWIHAGFPSAAPDGRVVFDAVEYDGNPPDAVAYITGTAELDSGRTLWTRRLPLAPPSDVHRARVWARSADGRFLATLRRDGRLAVRDLATGTQRVAELRRSWNEASLAIAGSEVLRVSMLKDRQRTLAAYTLYPLVERWALTDRSTTATLQPCGPVLCLRSPDGVQARDPVTGAVEWQRGEEWVDAVPIGPSGRQLRVTRAAQAPGGPGYLLVDAATGQEELDLGAWQPWSDGDTGAGRPDLLVTRREAGAHQPGHPEYDPGRLWLGLAGAGPRTVDLLGSLDGARWCALGTGHIACVTTQPAVEVWRVR